MTANSKSMMLLAATLVVGFALGLFADATLVRRRDDRLQGIRRPPGFVEHMIEDVIRPHSDAQRDSIKSIVERTAQQNQQIARDANDRLRAGLDSMRTALTPMLDAEQRERLSDEVAHMPAFGPGRGRGGRGGPPPFGRGGGRPGDRPPPPPNE